MSRADLPCAGAAVARRRLATLPHAPRYLPEPGPIFGQELPPGPVFVETEA